MLDVDHVGFTGSRWGMSTRQIDLLKEFLIARRRNSVEAWLHHGDCVGGDLQAHGMALQAGYKIRIHPPLNEKRRAFCEPYDSMEPPFSYSGRNQRIAVFSKVLYAAPSAESVGTWNCVDHAVRARVPVVIIHWDGQIENR